MEPDLASSWTVSPDGLTYLFHLRRDVRWSDGEPFAADDVLFTLGLMQDPDFPGVPDLSALWRTVTVEKVDAYTVRFHLSEPFPSFADYTTIGILPGDNRGAANPYVHIPIATGAGYTRNAAVVKSAQAVIAVGGSYGTLTEIGYALQTGIPVIGLGTWAISRNGKADESIITAAEPAEAVERALMLADD